MRGCLDNCKCKNCKNPLSVLKKVLNITDLSQFDGDFCFQNAMQNIKDKDFGTKLKGLVQGICNCGPFELKLSECLPRFICPNCETEFLYSWCLDILCDEINAPRCHCQECQECTRNFPCIQCSESSNEDKIPEDSEKIQESEEL